MPSVVGRMSRELGVLWHVLAHPVRGKTHEERLESFYRGQADGYDSFRRRLLHGRPQLAEALPDVQDGVWIDFGAGTGETVELLGSRVAQFRKVYLVDLCQSLLDVARQRITSHGWDNVCAVHADATSFRPAESRADLVTFSYSLTMIPEWYAALEHAGSLLRPDGVLGVTDFYVSRKHPAGGLSRHSCVTRHFWPAWFSADNVFLSPDHVPYLRRHFQADTFLEERGRIPWLPLVRVPYYVFIGRKRNEESRLGDLAPETVS